MATTEDGSTIESAPGDPAGGGEPPSPARAGAADDTTQAKLDELARLREEALHAGDERSVARQRERGKLLARERLEKLLDPGSFVELDRFVRHRNPHFGMMDRRP